MEQRGCHKAISKRQPLLSQKSEVRSVWERREDLLGYPCTLHLRSFIVGLQVGFRSLKIEDVPEMAQWARFRQRIMSKYQDFRTWFPDDAACRRYLEQIRWPNGARCPRCPEAKVWTLPPPFYRCANCGCDFTKRPFVRARCHFQYRTLHSLTDHSEHRGYGAETSLKKAVCLVTSIGTVIGLVAPPG